ncbi:branched-chain amino acid aminotransferase [Streptomyces yunnanensis]|uniref:Branched-chain-amino-acid aminotransferase n=1 Tax=Streptomyces yunnanensis TaxID=156453 RepID=A0A9X8R0E6_9ACTN|nr:branched-chain amino acid aminotransferase [Streptomyces yunnanensis]SHN33159.1 branched chain amino acid: 2-keto-4-methylthiobutyrate aminotransferase apoenzyme [Streptomyces yunnanensis]
MHIVSKPVARPLTPSQRAERTTSTAFGSAFTEHLVSVRWSEERGWHEAELRPYEPLVLDPATVGLHYGQAVFEGLKAFRSHTGSVGVFRPDAHARRMRASARRLMMPEPPEELFLAAVDALVAQDQQWIPDDPAMSLYLRPLLFASERTLALRPAREYRFLLMAFVTEGYFGPAQRPVRVQVTETYSRAAAGGTGAAKCAGNYAGSLLPQAEAQEQGFDQVVWLDPVERRWVEELGGMNLFFVYGSGRDARLVTPPLSGSLLAGVTRDALLRLAPALGVPAAEEPMSLEEWRRGCAGGELTEVFACGTAARITPVGEVGSADGIWTIGDGTTGEVTTRLSDALFGIQRGELPDRWSWMRPVAPAPQPAGT